MWNYFRRATQPVAPVSPSESSSSLSSDALSSTEVTPDPSPRLTSRQLDQSVPVHSTHGVPIRRPSQLGTPAILRDYGRRGSSLSIKIGMQDAEGNGDTVPRKWQEAESRFGGRDVPDGGKGSAGDHHGERGRAGLAHGTSPEIRHLPEASNAMLAAGSSSLSLGGGEERQPQMTVHVPGDWVSDAGAPDDETVDLDGSEDGGRIVPRSSVLGVGPSIIPDNPQTSLLNSYVEDLPDEHHDDTMSSEESDYGSEADFRTDVGDGGVKDSTRGDGGEADEEFRTDLGDDDGSALDGDFRSGLGRKRNLDPNAASTLLGEQHRVDAQSLESEDGSASQDTDLRRDVSEAGFSYGDQRIHSGAQFDGGDRLKNDSVCSVDGSADGRQDSSEEDVESTISGRGAHAIGADGFNDSLLASSSLPRLPSLRLIATDGADTRELDIQPDDTVYPRRSHRHHRVSAPEIDLSYLAPPPPMHRTRSSRKTRSVDSSNHPPPTPVGPAAPPWTDYANNQKVEDAAEARQKLARVQQRATEAEAREEAVAEMVEELRESLFRAREEQQAAVQEAAWAAGQIEMLQGHLVEVERERDEAVEAREEHHRALGSQMRAKQLEIERLLVEVDRARADLAEDGAKREALLKEFSTFREAHEQIAAAYDALKKSTAEKIDSLVREKEKEKRDLDAAHALEIRKLKSGAARAVQTADRERDEMAHRLRESTQLLVVSETQRETLAKRLQDIEMQASRATEQIAVMHEENVVAEKVRAVAAAVDSLRLEHQSRLKEIHDVHEKDMGKLLSKHESLKVSIKDREAIAIRENEELKKKVETERAVAQKLRDEKSELEAALEDKAIELSEILDRDKELKKMYSDLITQRYHEEYAAAEGFKSEIEALTSSLVKAREESGSTLAALQKQSALHEEIQHQLEQARAEAERAKADAAILEKAGQAKRAENEALTADIDALRRDLERLVAREADLMQMSEAAIAEAERRLEEERSASTALRLELEAAHAEGEILRQAPRGREEGGEEASEATKRELLTTSARVSELEMAETALTKELDLQLAEQQSELDLARAKTAKDRAALEDLQARLAARDEAVAGLETSLTQSRISREVVPNAPNRDLVARAETSEAELKAALAEAHASREEAAKSLADVRRQLEEEAEATTKLQWDMRERDDELANARKTHEAAEESNRHLTERVEALEQILVDLTTELASSRASSKELEKAVKNMSAIAASAETARADAVEKMSAIVASAETAREAAGLVEIAESKVKEYADAVEATKAELADVKRELATEKAHAEGLDQQIADLVARAEAAEMERDEATAREAEVEERATVAAAESGRILEEEIKTRFSSSGAGFESTYLIRSNGYRERTETIEAELEKRTAELDEARTSISSLTDAEARLEAQKSITAELQLALDETRTIAEDAVGVRKELHDAIEREEALQVRLKESEELLEEQGKVVTGVQQVLQEAQEAIEQYKEKIIVSEETLKAENQRANSLEIKLSESLAETRSLVTACEKLQDSIAKLERDIQDNREQVEAEKASLTAELASAKAASQSRVDELEAKLEAEKASLAAELASSVTASQSRINDLEAKVKDHDPISEKLRAEILLKEQQMAILNESIANERGAMAAEVDSLRCMIMDEADAKFADLEAICDALRRDVEAKAAELDTLRDTMRGDASIKAMELAALRDRVAALTDEAKDRELDLQTANDRTIELEERVMAEVRATESQVALVSRLTDEIKIITSEREHLAGYVHEYRCKIDALRENTASKEELEKATAEIVRWQQKAKAADDQVLQLEEKLEQIAREREENDSSGEMKILSDQVSDLMARFDAATVREDDLCARLATLNQQHAADVTDLQTRLQESAEEQLRFQEEAVQLREAHQEALDEITRLRGVEQELVEEVNGLAEQLEDARAGVAEWRSAADELNTLHIDTSTALGLLRTDHDALRERHETVLQDHDAAAAQAHEYQELLAEAEARIKELEADKLDLERCRDQLQTTENALRTEAADLNLTVAQLQAQMKSVEAKLEESESRIKELEVENIELKKACEQLQSTETALRAEAVDLNLVITRLQAQLTSIDFKEEDSLHLTQIERESLRESFDKIEGEHREYIKDLNVVIAQLKDQMRVLEEGALQLINEARVAGGSKVAGAGPVAERSLSSEKIPSSSAVESLSRSMALLSTEKSGFLTKADGDALRAKIQKDLSDMEKLRREIAERAREQHNLQQQVSEASSIITSLKKEREELLSTIAVKTRQMDKLIRDAGSSNKLSSSMDLDLQQKLGEWAQTMESSVAKLTKQAPSLAAESETFSLAGGSSSKSKEVAMAAMGPMPDSSALIKHMDILVNRVEVVSAAAAADFVHGEAAGSEGKRKGNAAPSSFFSRPKLLAQWQRATTVSKPEGASSSSSNRDISAPALAAEVDLARASSSKSAGAVVEPDQRDTGDKTRRRKPRIWSKLRFMKGDIESGDKGTQPEEGISGTPTTRPALAVRRRASSMLPTIPGPEKPATGERGTSEESRRLSQSLQLGSATVFRRAHSVSSPSVGFASSAHASFNESGVVSGEFRPSLMRPEESALRFSVHAVAGECAEARADTVETERGWASLKEVHRDMQAHHSVTAAEHEKLKAQFADMHAAYVSMHKAHAESSSARESLEAKIHAMSEIERQLQGELGIAERDKTEFAGKVAELEKRWAALRFQNAELTIAHAATIERRVRVEEQLAALESRHKTLENLYTTTVAHKDAMQMAREAEIMETNNIKRDALVLEGEMKLLRREMSDLRREKEGVEDRLRSVSIELSALQERHQQSIADNARLYQDLQSLDREFESLRSAHEEARDGNVKLQFAHARIATSLGVASGSREPLQNQSSSRSLPHGDSSEPQPELTERVIEQIAELRTRLAEREKALREQSLDLQQRDAFVAEQAHALELLQESHRATTDEYELALEERDRFVEDKMGQLMDVEQMFLEQTLAYRRSLAEKDEIIARFMNQSGRGGDSNNDRGLGGFGNGSGGSHSMGLMKTVPAFATTQATARSSISSAGPADDPIKQPLSSTEPSIRRASRSVSEALRVPRRSVSVTPTGRARSISFSATEVTQAARSVSHSPLATPRASIASSTPPPMIQRLPSGVSITPTPVRRGLSPSHVSTFAYPSLQAEQQQTQSPDGSSDSGGR
ncbi:hypothetical protein BDK51DRAFT_53223 [Blyttiomyces helicus]|uniref:Uncharacterized protein n=1 Tax=Blyttiomyces helicus TaxID=388810 RepID=A0A4V1ISP3_9FUNG|nr:hypothetical protein BDK51DRAFT_53223 [Blyttiomyces helicus]|eukprot:RKO94257.1 hypothetical protein BDK51DRAFT_53223 [Blyttiomyces helicus]